MSVVVFGDIRVKGINPKPYLRAMRFFGGLFQNILLGLLVVLPFFQTLGQNLLPNGDFEHPFISYEMQWKQPHGPYYHYYQDATEIGDAYRGQFYNGLCIYNHQENEFLQAKLSEPLQAGKRYCISTMARLMKIKAFNHELHDKIGILFTESPFDVEEPFDHNYTPQLFWLIPDSVNRQEWLSLDTVYEASGGEQYFTIGYFRSLGFSELADRKAVEAFLGPPPKTAEELNIPEPDFSQKGKKRRKKKKSKRGKDEWADFREEMSQKVQRKSEAIPTKAAGEGLFTLRYYIDDVCVAPQLADGNCDCSIAEPAVDLSKGATVRMDNLLFETGSDALKKGSAYALEILTLILNENPQMRIAIQGHTDNVGSDSDNLLLSRDRASAVYDYLIEAEIDANRLAFEGFGSTRPAAANDSAEGQKRNRRVEFQITDR